MNKFVRNLLTEWRRLKLPFENETILIAVSGGADSVSLALALYELQKSEKLKLKFIIGHFNHDLRGEESEKDAEFVKNLAEKLNFEFIGGITTDDSKLQDQKGNLEQLARHARYEFLERTSVNINAFAVLTAHTLNDQAETFLLRLIRGSGTDGLGGMPTVRVLNESQSESSDTGILIKLIRPFLNWAKREDTEEFCHRYKIEFRRDAMNESKDYSRVRVRKEIIPLLKTYNPKIIERLSQTTILLQEDSIALNIEAKKILEKAAGESSNIINYKLLAEIPGGLRKRVLRLWISENISNLRRIESKHIEAIEKLMFSRKSGRNTELPDGKIIIKNDGKLFFEKNKG